MRTRLGSSVPGHCFFSSAESGGDREGDGPGLLHDRTGGDRVRRGRQDSHKAAKRGRGLGQRAVVHPSSFVLMDTSVML